MYNSRKVYLNVIVLRNNKENPVRALIDAGKKVRAKSMMDKKLHKKLGVDFSVIGEHRPKLQKGGLD